MIRSGDWRLDGVFDTDEKDTAMLGEKSNEKKGWDGTGETCFGEGVGDVHKVDADECFQHIGNIDKEFENRGGAGRGSGGDVSDRGSSMHGSDRGSGMHGTRKEADG